LNLRTRLALAFTLTALAVIFGLGFTVDHLSGQATRRQVDLRMGHIAQGLAARIDRGMYERFQDIKTVALLDAPREAGEPLVRFRAQLERRQAAHPEFSWIGFADASGRVVASTRSHLEGADVSQRPWFGNALKGISVGDVHEAVLLQGLIGSATAEPLRFVDIAFAVGEPARPSGVLGAHVAWKWMDELADAVLRASGIQGAADLLIVSREGKVLRGPPGLQGTMLVPALFRPTADTGTFEAEWPDGKFHVTSHALTRGQGDYPGLGWRVFARQASEVAYAEHHGLRRLLLVGGALAILFSMGAGVYLAARLARPLEQWAKAADRIGAGERDVPLPQSAGSTEVVRVSAALRSMANRLAWKEDELQARINARTASLVEATNALEAERELLAHALEGSRLALWELDPETHQVRLSIEWSRMLNQPLGETVIQSADLMARVPEEDHAVVSENLAAVLKGEQDHYDVDHRVRRDDGSILWVRSRGHVTQRTPDGTAKRLVGTNADITARKTLEGTLAAQAFTDLATGLPNQRLLLDRLDRSLAQARREGHEVGVLFIDLDGFKAVNDALGHAAGDALLRQAAGRFQACTREVDTVARVGGDEFVVVLASIRNKADAAQVATKLIESLQPPFALAEGEGRVSCSIGIAVYPDDGDDPAELLRAADQRMYRAKSLGKGRYCQRITESGV